MKLLEMFSAIGAPKQDDQSIDWIGDLKFFIDNDDKMLSNYFFPAIKKHELHKGNPNAWKLYMPGLERCAEAYCSKYEQSLGEIFPKEKLIELAHQMAAEQERHIIKGDYAAT